MDKKGDYILTYTKKKFYAFDLDNEMFCLEDMFHSLSDKSRFCGHGRKRSYTVAEHTVRGVLLGRQLGFSDEVLRAFLLHDCSEAYLQDISAPIKPFLPDYVALEESVQNYIYTKYLGKTLDKELYTKVKYLDLTMLCNEMEQLMLYDSENPDQDWERPLQEYIFVDLNDYKSEAHILFWEKYLHELAQELGVHD